MRHPTKPRGINLGDPKSVQRHLERKADVLYKQTIKAAIPPGYDKDARRVLKALFVDGFVRGGLYTSQKVVEKIAAEEKRQANE